LLQARNKVSWTRSSASDTEPDNEIANARRCEIWATNSSLRLMLGAKHGEVDGEIADRR